MSTITHFFSTGSNTLGVAIIMAAIGAIIKLMLDERGERAQLRAQRLQDQIQQLYGPLFSVIDQLDTCDRIEPRIFHDNPLSDEQRETARRFMCYEFYLPLHKQIREIVQSKLYLIDGLAVPQSFRDYMDHSMQYEIQMRLWFEKGVASDKTPGTPYPFAFNDDIEFGLDNIMTRLGVTLQAMGNHAPDQLNISDRDLKRST